MKVERGEKEDEYHHQLHAIKHEDRYSNGGKERKLRKRMKDGEKRNQIDFLPLWSRSSSVCLQFKPTFNR